MTSDRLQDLERKAAADPMNRQAYLEKFIARGRVEGPEVYLEILADRLIWNESPAALQDLAIDVVAKSLGPTFELDDVSTYHCNTSHRIARFQHSNTGLLFHLLPGGQYQMGSEHGEGDYDELPVHTVTVKPFLIGRNPVRQKIWDIFGGEARKPTTGPDIPIEGVSHESILVWLDSCQAPFRLPSEAEWEYACRAGTNTEYFWGNDFNADYCWFDRNSDNRCHSVLEHVDKANAFGLVDMLGNVWEMCSDNWIPNYQDGPKTSLPRTGNSPRNVVRGGSWYHLERVQRCSYRFYQDRSLLGDYTGFRLVVDVDLKGWESDSCG